MTTRLNPYLGFRDTTREAMEFYQSVFGGKLTLSTFAEFEASDDKAEQDKIMHAMLTTDDEPVLCGYWDRLVTGGAVVMALEPSPWGDSFGMCVDTFGVSWMVNIAGVPA